MKDTAGKPVITVVGAGLVGTLVADDGLIERSFAEAIATQGVVAGTSAYAKRMAQVHQARGLAPADALATLFPDNQPRAQAALLAFRRALSDAIRRTEFAPLPGVVAALMQLSAAGVRVSVLTSLPAQARDAILAAAGLRSLIALALSAEEVSRGLPAPDLPLSALLRCGAGCVQELAVVHGTGAGVAAGVRSGAGIVAGVLTGPHPAARLRAAGAGQVLASFADVPALLLRAGQGEVAGAAAGRAAGGRPAGGAIGADGAAIGAGGAVTPDRDGRAAGLGLAQISIPAQSSLEGRRPGGSRERALRVTSLVVGRTIGDRSYAWPASCRSGTSKASL